MGVVKKAIFILRLIVFVLTVRYAVMFARCVAEYAWTSNPSQLITATFMLRLNYLESEEIQKLYAAVKELPFHYEKAMGTRFETLEWCLPVVEAVEEFREEYEGDEAGKKEFLAAWKSYLEVVEEINDEANEAGVAATQKPESQRLYGKDEVKHAHLQARFRGREKHFLAVRNMLGKIPYRYASSLAAWQANCRLPGKDVDPFLIRAEIPCEQVWTKRYGDALLAEGLAIFSFIFVFLGVGSVIISAVEKRLFGTRIVEWFQVLIFGELWSVYYDTPRQVLLWLLERFGGQGMELAEEGARAPTENIVIVERTTWT